MVAKEEVLVAEVLIVVMVAREGALEEVIADWVAMAEVEGVEAVLVEVAQENHLIQLALKQILFWAPMEYVLWWQLLIFKEVQNFIVWSYNMGS